MTRLLFTRHGLKVVSVAFGIVIVGLMAVCGVIGAIAFPAVAGDTIEKDMNWLGEIISLLMIIPGATVLTAYSILDDQEKKAAKELRRRERRDFY